MRRLLHSTQPSALLVDGRTATQFCLRSKADGSLERFTDVLGWSEAGAIASWVRVFEPQPTQRDWLQMLGSGRTKDLPSLLGPTIGFVMVESATKCQSYPDAPTAREALETISARMAHHVSHIGRTRELSEWVWHRALPPPPAAKKVQPGAPTRVVQAVFIGAWRPLGGKWYGEAEVAMRETAEWRGRSMCRIMWEKLPEDHPQAKPVWKRLHSKRRRARARQAASASSNAAEGATHTRRPAWNDTVAPVPAVSAKGLKTAKDKEPAPRPKDLGLRTLG